jgi:cellulose synthase/poly-beta-1,6-N-acetylglucosamine synthase-like glycosyltransferase
MWIAAVIVFLTVIFWIIGHEGIMRLNTKRSRLVYGNMPPVSVIIPAYRADKTIAQTIRSVKDMDYPKKEIIVVNDSDDKTPQICKKYGVKLIQNKKRMGKSVSLDIAGKKAKNDILFFIDADTTVAKDALKKVMPWFQDTKIVSVMPTFIAKNSGGIAKMVSIENIFTHSHLRTHMHFGSLISFRGCCFAVRKSALKKAGGWGQALTEDNDMGAKIAKSGKAIQWEPEAIAMTDEPETVNQLKKQKIRWGAGSAYSFFRHRKYYMKSPQFLLYFLPYIILGFLTSFLVLWYLYLMVSTLSITPLFGLIREALLITVATYFHITVLVYSERGFINPGNLLKYMTYYTPLVTYFYFRGMIKGIKGKKRKMPEMDLNLW